ncbi:MAG TPA: hypothetical protein VN132_12260 [Bdellovibrio sp.]|nr:hypothetical protein [Bdellovibrio sp.]
MKQVISLFIGLLLPLFFSLRVYASTIIESEFELALPRAFQQGLINQKWNDLINKEFSANWPFSDQIVTVDYGLQIHLEGLSMTVKTQMQKPNLGQSQTKLTLQSQSLQAQMQIGTIWVDQTILQTLGGITARVHVQAQCKNISLNMTAGSGSFSIDLTPSVNPSQVSSTVQDVNLSWQPNAWTIAPFTCTGVSGFDHMVTQALQNISADSKSFVTPRKAQIISSIQNYLNGVITLNVSKPRELISARADIPMSMVIDSFDDSNPNMTLAKGRLTLEFTRVSPSTTTTKKLVLNGTMTPTNSGQAQLRLPSSFIKEVMTQAYAANTWIHQIPSSQLPGFSSVMNSRFIQFFIWPELMRYPKSSQFQFNVYSNQEPQISGQGLQYQVGLQLLSQMLAPKNGSQIPFMNFTIPFSSQVKIFVANSKVSAKFTGANLKLQYGWDSSYVTNYNPSKRFSASTIRSYVVNALNGTGASFSIPTLPIAEGLSLQVSQIQTLSNSNSDLVLQVVPAP